MEPFRIKSIEPIKFTTQEERQELIIDASYNLFLLKADDVIIDLLTDSGTSAMSSEQWSALINGDESYAGSRSFYKFEETIQNLIPFKHIIPTHQGRAAEQILFSILGGPGKIIPNNTHFDTTRGNIESTGATALDLMIDEAHDPSKFHPFKGNMDVEKLRTILKQNNKKIPCVMLTITNNAGGGQPVSLKNIFDVKQICKEYNKPLIIDGCRFAENAYFNKIRDPELKNKTIKQIIYETFIYADGMTMSAKKDALVNIGGWIGINDDGLADEIRNRLILTEGFPTYGGLAGRDLEAIAQGLVEVIDEEYLKYRIDQVRYFGNGIKEVGAPIIEPIGGHAVFIDTKQLLPHIKPLNYPGQALAVELYKEGGIRGVEIGSVMFGLQPDGTEKSAPMELVRLAIPRRVYTNSHLDYCIEKIANIVKRCHTINGYEIIWQPKRLRHFTVRFKPLNNNML